MSAPEFDEDNLTKQNLTDLLNIRDLCILMIQTRGHFKERIEGNYFSGYDYNTLSREMGFLLDIKIAISKNILFRLKTNTNLSPFEDAESKFKIANLELDSCFLATFFNKELVQNQRYEIVKIAKLIFIDFSRCISEDWSFL